MPPKNDSKVQINLRVLALIVTIVIGATVITAYFTDYVNAKIEEKAYPNISGVVLETELKAIKEQLDRIEEKLK